MDSFWVSLQKPIFLLAPMEDVTDCAFREMFALHSGAGLRFNAPAPNGVVRAGIKESPGNKFVMFTEFVSVDGLMHPEGRERLKIDLAYTEIQRPIVAQIWGADPEKFGRVTEWLVTLGFDGIDINMGCPQSKEIAAGSCAALIRNPKLAQEIIRAVQKSSNGLPVSVKTRLGYSKVDEMEDWVKYLLDTEIDALTLHARTKKEMSKVPAHWEKIADAVKFRDQLGSKTLIIGNGDIKSREEGVKRVRETGCDGVMVGRGAFGNPWFFRQPAIPHSDAGSKGIDQIQNENQMYPDPVRQTADKMHSDSGMTHGTPSERLRVMLEHAELFEKMYAGIKSFFIMRKHFKAYCSGFPGASELRMKLMETKDLEETKRVVEEYFV
jgi:tRNA-dihydrouridine synthase